MCRGATKPLPPLKDNSSLRQSGILRAETRLEYGRNHLRLHDDCEKCGAAFTDKEKDNHLNHSRSTEWAGVLTIEEPICQRCRESNPEYGFEGQCSYCGCAGCTTDIPRNHCGTGGVMVVAGYGAYILGCRRAKRGSRLPEPHISGDTQYCKCECLKCQKNRDGGNGHEK